MKNIILLVVVFSFVFGLSSCDKGWFEPKPLSFYSPDAFKSKEDLDALLLAARAGLRNEFLARPNRNVTEYYFTDMSLGAIWLSNYAHNAELQVLPTSEPFNSYIFWYFDNAYSVFKNVNIIVSRIDHIKLKDEQERNEILAEAYFHRAYHYYRLVHQFGDVPYVGSELTTPRTDFQTFTRESVLQKIKKDMEFAVEWLPEKVFGGKVNKAAGNHLLTKIYLSVREFDNAVKSAGRVIDSGNYQLMTERFGTGPNADDPEYNVLWDLHQKENISVSANKEAILVAQNAYDMDGNAGQSSFNDVWIPYWRNIPGCEYNLGNGVDEQEARLGRGNSWVRTCNYFNYYMAGEDPNDFRYSKHNWFKMTDFYYNLKGYAKYGESVNPLDVGADTTATLFPFFYYKLNVPQETSGNFQGGWTDYYVYRLAETYLLRAEAYWWKGDLENATKDINTLRARANASQKASSDITLDYIINERSRELYREEPRKTELTRVAYIMACLGKDGYSLDNMHEKNWYYDKVMRTNNYFREEIYYGGQYYRIKPYHVYWPIPQSVIDANTDCVINQNKGYSGFENNIVPKNEITDLD